MYKLRFPDLGSSWKSVFRFTHLPFSPGKITLGTITKELGWISEPVWRIWRTENET
jgi:hypothetical protein